MPKCVIKRDEKGRFAGCMPGTGGGSSGGGGGKKSGGGSLAGGLPNKVDDLQAIAKKEGIDIDTLSHKARKSVLAAAINAKRAGKDLREEGLLKSTKAKGKKSSSPNTSVIKKPSDVKEEVKDYKAIARLGADFVKAKVGDIDKINKSISAMNKEAGKLTDDFLEAQKKGLPTQPFIDKLVDFNKRKEAVFAKQDKAYEDLRKEIYKATPLTKDEAIALAKQTDFSGIKYKADRAAAEATLADYYHFTGGQGSTTIKTVVADSDRAYAKTWDSFVDLGSDMITKTAWHEFAHHGESESKKILNANTAWREGKATAKDPEPMADLTGNKAYDSSEVGLRDNFVDPYVGKVYPDSSQATEVYSMGIERFSSAPFMRQMRSQDPDHFNLIIGHLINR